MIRAAVCALAAFILACQASADASAQPSPAPQTQAGITYTGGDGSSVAQAVVIRGAANSLSGIRAEYAWLAQRYAGYKRKTQSLLNVSEQMYDQLELETADGQSRIVFFDITELFGKR